VPDDALEPYDPWNFQRNHGNLPAYQPDSFPERGGMVFFLKIVIFIIWTIFSIFVKIALRDWKIVYLARKRARK